MSEENWLTIISEKLPDVSAAIPPGTIQATQLEVAFRSAFNAKPALRECTKLSVCAALVNCAALGLTAKTGLTVRDHQRLTIERFDRLRAATAAPLLPVLQGFKPHEYREHLADYGHRLALGARVGVGSVCKRNSHPAMIEYILGGIKADRPDLRLHGFGLKLTALNRPGIRGLLHSADSMAWSLNARKNGRDAHDWREAAAYEKRVTNPDQSLELWS